MKANIDLYMEILAALSGSLSNLHHNSPDKGTSIVNIGDFLLCQHTIIKDIAAGQ